MKRSLVFKLSLLANGGLLATLCWLGAKPTLNASAVAGLVQPGQLDVKQADSGGNSQGGIDFLCHRRRDQYIETGARFLELQLDLEANQTALLTTVKETLTISANESFNSLCTDLTASGQTPTAPEKLAQYQNLAVAANTVFGEVRPTFDSFYASLSAEQQRQLDAMLNRQNR